MFQQRTEKEAIQAGKQRRTNGGGREGLGESPIGKKDESSSKGIDM